MKKLNQLTMTTMIRLSFFCYSLVFASCHKNSNPDLQNKSEDSSKKNNTDNPINTESNADPTTETDTKTKNEDYSKKEATDGVAGGGNKVNEQEAVKEAPKEQIPEKLQEISSSLDKNNFSSLQKIGIYNNSKENNPVLVLDFNENEEKKKYCFRFPSINVLEDQTNRKYSLVGCKIGKDDTYEKNTDSKQSGHIKCLIQNCKNFIISIAGLDKNNENQLLTISQKEYDSLKIVIMERFSFFSNKTKLDDIENNLFDSSLKIKTSLKILEVLDTPYKELTISTLQTPFSNDGEFYFASIDLDPKMTGKFFELTTTFHATVGMDGKQKNIVSQQQYFPQSFSRNYHSIVNGISEIISYGPKDNQLSFLFGVIENKNDEGPRKYIGHVFNLHELIKSDLNFNNPEYIETEDSSNQNKKYVLSISQLFNIFK